MHLAARPDLLDVLAPALRPDGVLRPCAVLRHLLSPPAGRITRLTEGSLDQAAVLAAVCFQFAQALARDLDGLPPPPARTPVISGRLPAPRRVRLGRLSLKPLPAEVPRLPIATQSFLTALPLGLVRQLVYWAPPVVSPPPEDEGPVPVVGNTLVAFIASRRIPDESVHCWILKSPAESPFTLIEAAVAAHVGLPGVCAKYRSSIVHGAPDSKTAQLLSGLKRARVFRIRQFQTESEP